MDLNCQKSEPRGSGYSHADTLTPATAPRINVSAAINEVLQRALECESEEEVAQVCLDVAERLTRSEFGFIGEINERGRLDTIAQGDTGWAACRMPESAAVRMIRDMEIRGIWGRVLKDERPLIVNDPSSHPDRVGTPDGHPPIVRFLGVPLKRNGETLGMIGLANKDCDYDRMDLQAVEALSISFETVLAHHRSKERVLRLVDELERRVAERTRDLEEFAYSVSHDLRAPLRAVSGFAQILARRHREGLTEEGRHYVDNVVEAAGQMDRLIDDLLHYSRLGRSAVREENVPLSEILAGVAGTFGQRVASAGARLEIADEMPAVRGDPSLLTQVFTNLIDNALTYHAPGVAPRVVVDSSLDGEDVLLRVRDKGIGIEPEYREKVFAMFQRLHGDDEYPGTGIGLAIVRKAVGLQGGQVWVESAPGGGSVFVVRLPRHAQSTPKKEPNE